MKNKNVKAVLMALTIAATTLFSEFGSVLPVNAEEITVEADDTTEEMSENPVALAETGVDHLIINQVYGSGENDDTPIANSFVEIYNPTGESVNLGGYSLQIGSDMLELSDASLAPGASWLVIGNEKTVTDEFITYDLPEADQNWAVTISNKNYTVELQNSGTAVDSVTADQNEKAVKISKQKSLRRIDYADTDTYADFTLVSWKKGDVTVDQAYIDAYAPRNSKGEKGNVHVSADPANPTDPTDPTNPSESGQQEPSYTSVETSNVKITGFANKTASLGMELYARYNSGALCADGGSMEIVEYNEANGYAYAVSGLKGKVVAIPVKGVTSGETVTELAGIEIDVKALVESAAGVEGFVYGDVTSVAISPDGTLLAASVQHADYDKNGVAAIFTCNADGSLTVNKLIPVGVQPDMITFVDGNVVLTADEGEPRQGYGEGTVDPKGTVSIVDINAGTSVQAGFENFTADGLASQNVIVGVANGAAIAPEYDMEPEYIAVSADKSKAYVALQEANAIGVLDIQTATFTGIYSAGFEDFSKVSVDLIEDGKYTATTYDNLVGARMPDGIAVYSVGGVDYLVTANEGDAREWGDYCNESKTKNFTGKNIKVLDTSLCSGLPEGKAVMFGGRGFTIYQISDTGLTEVFDSGSDFEKITAQYLPNYFNASNDDIKVDSRSTKKGPEPENVTIGQVNGRTYVFVAVERIGGVMVYDVTNPSGASFVNYINSRDFTGDIKGDVSPEGICFIGDNGNGVPVVAASCEVSGTVAFYELTAQQVKENDIVVLYTNDVHNAYEQAIDDKTGKVTCLGYAAVAQYKKDMETAGNYVELVDAGDAIQGGVIGALSQGSYLVDIMNQTGYSIGVPGNHEFDFGMDRFLELAENKAEYDYVSCNFIDLRTNEPVFDSYEIKSYGDVDVAYIGITTPETYIKSTPTYFQDENGVYIYGFCEGNNGKNLYNRVQTAINEAKADGADYIVAIGHAGVDSASSPWTSKEIIANTTGLDAFIDGHSHSTIASEECTDKEGNTVVLSSTGTKLSSLGKMVIKADGTITSELVTDYTAQDEATLTVVNEITEQFKALKDTVVAKTEADLVINDPVSGKRMVRKQETNLGDLCADAYRTMLGADIAFVNGGGIRVDVKQGEVTYGDVISVHPFGNMACLIEATGQQILDALELGSSAAGIGEGAGELGGFLQVSGLTYDIDTTIPSSVVKTEKGEFVKVDGEYRVKNVMVGGKPLDLNKTYTLASHNYMLKSGGDGYTMFKGNKILKDEVMVDNEVLINYIKNTLGGNIKVDSIYANPYGEGRIRVITAYQAATETEDGYLEYLQGSTTVREVVKAIGSGATEEGNTGSTTNEGSTENTGNTTNEGSTENTGNTTNGESTGNTGNTVNEESAGNTGSTTSGENVSSNQGTNTKQNVSGSVTITANDVWKNVADRISTIPEKGTLNVNMDAQTVVPKEFLSSLRGQDKTVVFALGNGMKWSINGKTITADMTDIDLGVSLNAGNIPADTLNRIAQGRDVIKLSLAYDGEFHCEATLTAPVGTAYAGKYANLYYYNPGTGKMEFISSGQIGADGNVALKFTHASDYAIVIDNEAVTAVQTGDHTPIASEVLLLCAGLMMFAYAWKKKKIYCQK